MKDTTNERQNSFAIGLAVGALLCLASAVASAQAAPIPRDTTAARQLEAIATTLRQPVTLPVRVDTIRRTDTVRVATLSDSAARRAIADVLRVAIDTINRDSSRPAYVTRARQRLDSLRTSLLVVATPTPTPDPVPTPAPAPDPTPIPVPPPSGSTAELPRVTLDYPYPTPTRTVTVASNLQAALNAAQRGDELVLSGTHTGNYSVTSCGPGWITVRMAGTVASTRRTPSQSTQATVTTPNTEPAIRATASACRWRFVGFEVTLSTTAQHYGLIHADGTDIVLDRMWVHGQADSQLIRCVTMNGARQSVEKSWLSDCHAKGFDSQAISGIHGPGPFKIHDNHLEGAGENVFFGGGDPSSSGTVPSDITITGNHFYTPPAWKGVWSKKNLLEFKNAARVLVEGNVLDGSWQDGQLGEAIVIKSVNQDGGCRWCRSTDITVRRNLIRNVGAGFLIAGRPEANPVDTAARRIHVSENVLDGVRQGVFTGSGRAVYLGSQASSVTFERNVFAGNLHSALLPEAGAPCTFRDNVWGRGEYGIIATGFGPGAAGLNAACGSSLVWSGMTFVGTANGQYPPGTTWVSAESQAPLAAQIRSVVQQATAGVVVPPQ